MGPNYSQGNRAVNDNLKPPQEERCLRGRRRARSFGTVLSPALQYLPPPSQETSMPDYSLVKVDRDGPLGILTLNRPEKLNALSNPMLEEFDRALAELGADPEVRVLIIKGAGRAFSAGYDISPAGPMKDIRT